MSKQVHDSVSAGVQDPQSVPSPAANPYNVVHRQIEQYLENISKESRVVEDDRLAQQEHIALPR